MRQRAGERIGKEIELGRYRLLIIGALCAALAGCSSSGKDSGRFLAQSMQDGLAEIRMCQLALERSRHEEVKQFARRMIEAHTQIDDELRSLAAKKRVSVPHESSAKQKVIFDLLSAAPDEAFERDFISHNVSNHEAAVKDFATQAGNGTDPEVKAFAARTSKTLKEHLQSAREVEQQLRFPQL